MHIAREKIAIRKFISAQTIGVHFRALWSKFGLQFFCYRLPCTQEMGVPHWTRDLIRKSRKTLSSVSEKMSESHTSALHDAGWSWLTNRKSILVKRDGLCL